MKRAKSPTGRLTDEQYALMGAIVIETSKHGGEPTLWSPRGYLGRPPTNTEGATLSRRLSALVERGLVERNGKLVRLTELGKSLLLDYAENVDTEKIKFVLIALEIEENLRQHKIIAAARDLLQERKMLRVRLDAVQGTATVLSETAHTLDSLQEQLIEESIELGIRLQRHNNHHNEQKEVVKNEQEDT
jgi:hypothetical protein